MSEIVKISEFSKVRRGASPRPIEDQSFFGGDVGWVRISDVTASNKFLRKTEQYLSPKGVAASVLVQPGDVVMSICGTVGRPILVDMNACIHDGFVQIYDINDVFPEYLYYLLQFHERDFNAMGQSGTQTNLNTTLVGGLKVFKPSLNEQKKIAEILSSIDRQIELTEMLIDKKKEIKRGLVHDLILSKAHDVPIEDVVDILDNLRIPVNDDERQKRGGNVPYYGANGLQGFIDKPLFNEPLILMAEDGGNFEQFAQRPIAYRIAGPSWVNNHAHILRAKNYNQDYLFYVLEHMNILSLISGGTRAKLNQGELKNIKVPSTEIAEQNRVANLIDLVVDEINKLMLLAEKLHSQKQGLMQDLLTGRVRVN